MKALFILNDPPYGTERSFNDLRLAKALAGVKRVLVVEQNHSGQFHRYLRADFELPGEVRSLHRPGPLPIRPDEVYQKLTEWSHP